MKRIVFIIFIYLLSFACMNYGMLSRSQRELIAKNVSEHQLSNSYAQFKKQRYLRDLEKQTLEAECKKTHCIASLGNTIQIDCDGNRFVVDSKTLQVLTVCKLALHNVSER